MSPSELCYCYWNAYLASPFRPRLLMALILGCLVESAVAQTADVVPLGEASVSIMQAASEIRITVPQAVTPHWSTLTSPPRLVVDLRGMTIARPRTIREGLPQQVEAIRIGAHPDKLRIVFDLVSDEISPEVELVGEAVVVRLTDIPQATREATPEPTPASTPSLTEAPVPTPSPTVQPSAALPFSLRVSLEANEIRFGYNDLDAANVELQNLGAQTERIVTKVTRSTLAGDDTAIDRLLSVPTLIVLGAQERKTVRVVRLPTLRESARKQEQTLRIAFMPSVGAALKNQEQESLFLEVRALPEQVQPSFRWSRKRGELQIMNNGNIGLTFDQCAARHLASEGSVRGFSAFRLTPDQTRRLEIPLELELRCLLEKNGQFETIIIPPGPVVIDPE